MRRDTKPKKVASFIIICDLSVLGAHVFWLIVRFVLDKHFPSRCGQPKLVNRSR
jgi:hypothetical protein